MVVDERARNSDRPAANFLNRSPRYCTPGRLHTLAAVQARRRTPNTDGTLNWNRFYQPSAAHTSELWIREAKKSWPYASDINLVKKKTKYKNAPKNFSWLISFSNFPTFFLINWKMAGMKNKLCSNALDNPLHTFAKKLSTEIAW